jgi:hypothetical protein
VLLHGWAPELAVGAVVPRAATEARVARLRHGLGAVRVVEAASLRARVPTLAPASGETLFSGGVDEGGVAAEAAHAVVDALHPASLHQVARVARGAQSDCQQ